MPVFAFFVRARFLCREAQGLKAYRAAGGHIVTDLFQSDDEGYLADPALLDRLCAERLEREAEAIRAEGWKWVQIMPEASYEAVRRYSQRRACRLRPSE